METVEVLKIKVSMPSAHFRVIHSSNPRRTYPAPPYSTVIGFLANLLGEDEIIQKMLGGTLALGVLSRFESVSREYTWLRNLEKSQHLSRYFTPSNRSWQGVAEHPGGQGPVRIEVLNEVEIFIYVYHSDALVLQVLEQNILLPDRWLNHTHLGRSEDWAVVEPASKIELELCSRASSFQNSSLYYQWLPDPRFYFGASSCDSTYGQLYRKVVGPAVLVTSLYRLVDVPYKHGRIGKIRNFDHIPARLFCSSVPFLDDFSLPALLVDESLKVPVFLARISSEGDRCARLPSELGGKEVQQS